MSRADSHGRTSPPLPFLAYLLFLLFPSSHVVHRFLGWPGLGAYFLLAVLFFVALRQLSGWWRRHVTTWRALALFFFTFLILLAGFLFFFPRADAGLVGGGSDRDDALNVAVRELLDGRYPYYARTYLDNPISPLPGSLLLSAPFVLLGDSATQNLFWLAALFVAAWWGAGRAGDGLLLLWLILAGAPIVLREILTGSDLLANSLFVFLFVLLLCRRDASIRGRLVAAVLLGLALASRAHFLLLLPPVFAFLSRREGVRRASVSILAGGLTFLALTLPFFLYDPAGFAPLHVAGRLALFGVRPPFTWLIPLLAAGLALLLSLPRRATFESLALACAIVLAAPFVMSLGAPLLLGDPPALRLISYGLSALPFGAWFVWTHLLDAAR